MQTILPYTVNPDHMKLCERMKLLDPHSGAVTSPQVTAKEPKLLVGGLLHNWDVEAAQALQNPAPQALTWDLSWTAAETRWEQEVHRCLTPEDVEDLLPSKWIGYNVESDRDETLARVCKLCTALVDRFVQLSQGNNAILSTSKWRQHQTLYDRLGAVMELLEASVGEAVPIYKLRDPNFMRQLWTDMPDEDRREIVAALSMGETDEE